MSATQAAQRERFGVSGSSESGGIRLNVTAIGRTGDFDIEVDISSPSFLPGPEVALSDIRVRVTPASIARLQNWFQGLSSDLSSRAGLSSSFLRRVITPDLPSPSAFEFSDRISAGTSFPVSFTYNVPTFQPVKVPDVEGVRNRMPEVEIDVSLTPTGLFGIGGWLFSDLPSETLTLPAEAFVDFVEVSAVGDCDEIYPDIERNLDRLEQGLVNIVQLEQDVRDLEDIKSNIEDRAGGRSIRDISPQDLTGTVQDAIGSWTQRARQADATPVAGGQTLSGLSSLENRIENELESGRISGNCLREFQNRYGTLRGRLGRFNELSNRVFNLKQQVLDALQGGGFTPSVPCVSKSFESDVSDEMISGRDIQSRIDDAQDDMFSNPEAAFNNITAAIADIQRIPSGECRDEFMSQARSIRSRVREQRQERISIDVPSLDCADVPRYVKNIVAGAETEANSFSNIREVSRTPRKMYNIESTIENAKEQVEDQVTDDNPCKDQLLGRLESASSILRSAAPDPEALSCEGRFESLDNRLTSLEEDALSVDPPVSAQQFELFASRAENIVDDIEGDIPEGDRCRRQFIRRTDGVVNRVGRVGARVRIITELTNEEIEERQQVIDELRDRLQTAGGRERRGGGILNI